MSAVRTPAEAVPEAEFFLVDPVRCAVDDGIRAVPRQLCDLEVVEVLHIKIVLPDICHPLSVRENLANIRVGAASPPSLRRLQFFRSSTQ